jgi:hypothetical protein
MQRVRLAKFKKNCQIVFRTHSPQIIIYNKDSYRIDILSNKFDSMLYILFDIVYKDYK